MKVWELLLLGTLATGFVGVVVWFLLLRLIEIIKT